MRDDKSFLEDAMSFASQEARYHVADSLACHLHNDGYTLEGNTEANDADWFARNIYEQERSGLHSWQHATPEEVLKYRGIAIAVMGVLPSFQLRIAHRLITLSKVVRDIERVERKRHDENKRKARP